MTEENDIPIEDHSGEYDEELIALAQSEPPSVLRPVLMIAVIAMAVWIVSDWQSELEYFFSSSEPVDLGDATDFAIKAAEDPDWRPDIPHNRYVSIRGIPSRRSQSARYRYSKLAGSWVFVEARREDADLDPIERELAGTNKGETDRTYFRGSGRIVDFTKMPERYLGLRDYYTRRYKQPFCTDLTDAKRKEIRQRQRDSIIQQIKAEYDAATPEEREKEGLKPTITDEEINQIFANNPVCVDAYLLQVDVKPSDYWWYLAASIMFGLFMLFNVVLLIRWVRQTMRS